MARNQSTNESIVGGQDLGMKARITTVDYPGIKGKQKRKQCRYGNIRCLMLELTKEIPDRKKR